MFGRAVLCCELRVLRLHGREVPGEFAQRIGGCTRPQVAGLGEGREGVVDARDGDFVGTDIEVLDRVVDELARRRGQGLVSARA